MANWYWLRDGKRHGPIDTQHLRKLAKEGQLRSFDMISRDGLTWVLASRAKGLFPDAESQSSTPSIDHQEAGPLQRSLVSKFLIGLALAGVFGLFGIVVIVFKARESLPAQDGEVLKVVQSHEQAHTKPTGRAETEASSGRTTLGVKQDDKAKRGVKPPASQQQKTVAEASQQMLDTLRKAYFILIEVSSQRASSNRFVQEERDKQLADARREFSDVLSKPFPVIGWSIFVTEVKLNDAGQIEIRALLATCEGWSDVFQTNVSKGMSAVFVVQNKACAEKAKTIASPCLVKVHGRYTGRRDTNPNEENDGYYTLRFDLDDLTDMTPEALRH